MCGGRKIRGFRGEGSEAPLNDFRETGEMAKESSEHTTPGVCSPFWALRSQLQIFSPPGQSERGENLWFLL